jgi:hypothetical protein
MSTKDWEVETLRQQAHDIDSFWCSVPSEWESGRSGLLGRLTFSGLKGVRFLNPGTPLSSCSPRWANSMPDPTTRSLSIPRPATANVRDMANLPALLIYKDQQCSGDPTEHCRVKGD